MIIVLDSFSVLIPEELKNIEDDFSDSLFILIYIFRCYSQMESLVQNIVYFIKKMYQFVEVCIANKCCTKYFCQTSKTHVTCSVFLNSSKTFEKFPSFGFKRLSWTPQTILHCWEE